MSYYPERFEREMGCTKAEWLMWLPGAMGAPLEAAAAPQVIGLILNTSPA